jgi:hypothetical protein
MSRDYTLRVLQSMVDRANNLRKAGKRSGNVQPKSLKKLRPPTAYKVK